MSDQNEMMKKTLEGLGIPEKDVKRKARIIDNISIDDIYEALGLPLDPEHKPWALKDPTPFDFAKKTFHMLDDRECAWGAQQSDSQKLPG